MPDWAWSAIAIIIGMGLNAAVVGFSYGRLTERVTAQGQAVNQRIDNLKESIPQQIKSGVLEHQVKCPGAGQRSADQPS
jgi:uncharacterized membrane-anchored protein YhcB (DUF1043 family)